MITPDLVGTSGKPGQDRCWAHPHPIQSCPGYSPRGPPGSKTLQAWFVVYSILATLKDQPPTSKSHTPPCGNQRPVQTRQGAGCASFGINEYGGSISLLPPSAVPLAWLGMHLHCWLDPSTRGARRMFTHG